jgi:hypothetical protein
MTTIVVARPCCYSSITKNCLGIFITLSKIQKIDEIFMSKVLSIIDP